MVVTMFTEVLIVTADPPGGEAGHQEADNPRVEDPTWVQLPTHRRILRSILQVITYYTFEGRVVC